MRYSNADSDGDCYVYPNADSDGDCYVYSNADSDGNGNSNSHSYSHSYTVSDADVHTWGFTWAVDAGCASSDRSLRRLHG
jgi:hypothetical protein